MDQIKDGATISYYYGISVPPKVSSSGLIHIMADEVHVQDGVLYFTLHDGKGNQYTGLGLAKGQWYNFWPASTITGDPINVEHWDWTRKTEDDLCDSKLVRGGLRFKVLERDGYSCCLCGRTKEDGVQLDVDHIIPRTEGGQNTLDNLRTLCTECNGGKGAKTEKSELRNDIDAIVSVVKKNPGLNQHELSSLVRREFGIGQTRVRSTIPIAIHDGLIYRANGKKGYAHYAEFEPWMIS